MRSYNHSRRGFTIVELLMVIGIIGVLTGIVTTAASTALKNSRSRRRDALCAIVQAGLATYHAKEGQWPITSLSHKTNMEGDDRKDDPNKRVLSGSETKTCIYKLAEKAKQRDPVMDVSGLFVSRDDGRYGSKAHGMDFMSAIHGTRKSSQKMKLNDMYFGYPDPATGCFRHFKIIYSIPADSMKVTYMDDDSTKARYYE